MNMKETLLLALLFLVGCVSIPVIPVTPDVTVSVALGSFLNSTTLGNTTYADFVSRYGEGQDWMRGNMPNEDGASQFCWTLIFRQTDGTVYVNFSTDDLRVPMREWTLYSITSKIEENRTEDEDIVIDIEM
jgi:hypothetical protein